jgi:hypothetical protein
MTMLSAGHSELRRAFHEAKAQSDVTTGPASHLLHFYAAECGLKYLYLRRNKLLKTSQIANEKLLSRHGHDLPIWARELKLAVASLSSPTQVKLKRGENCKIDCAHQAWRYGIELDADSETQISNWIKRTIESIKQEIK